MSENQLNLPERNKARRMTINPDLIYFKNDMLGDLKQQEHKLNKKIDKQTDDTQKKLDQFQLKLDVLTGKLFSLASLFTENNNLKEKIESLLQFKTKAEETILNHDIKIASISKDLVNAINKYDKLIENNIFYHGIIGTSNSRFQNFHNFIDYVLKSIGELVLFKDKVINLDFKGQKTELEALIEGLKKQAENITVGCKIYTTQCLDNLEKKIKSDLNLFEQKFFDIKIQNGENFSNLKELSHNLMNDWKKIEEMKQEMEKSYNLNSQLLQNHYIETQKRIKEYEKENNQIKKKLEILIEYLKGLKIGNNTPFSEYLNKEKGNEFIRKSINAESYLKKYIVGEVGMDEISHISKKHTNKSINNLFQSQKSILIDNNNEYNNNVINNENVKPFNLYEENTFKNKLSQSTKTKNHISNSSIKAFNNNLQDDKNIINNNNNNRTKRAFSYKRYNSSYVNHNPINDNLDDIKEEVDYKKNDNELFFKNDLLNFNKAFISKDGKSQLKQGNENNGNNLYKSMNLNYKHNFIKENNGKKDISIQKNNSQKEIQKVNINIDNTNKANIIKDKEKEKDAFQQNKTISNNTERVIIEQNENNSSCFSDKSQKNNDQRKNDNNLKVKKINSNKIIQSKPKENNNNIIRYDNNNNDNNDDNDVDYNIIEDNNDNQTNTNNNNYNLMGYLDEQNEINNALFKSDNLSRNYNSNTTKRQFLPSSQTFNSQDENNFKLVINNNNIDENNNYEINNDKGSLYINPLNKMALRNLLKGDRNALRNFTLVKGPNALSKSHLMNKNNSHRNVFSYTNKGTNYDSYRSTFKENNLRRITYNKFNKMNNTELKNVANNYNNIIDDKYLTMNLPYIYENFKNNKTNKTNKTNNNNNDYNDNNDNNDYNDYNDYNDNNEGYRIINQLRKIKNENNLYLKKYGPKSNKYRSNKLNSYKNKVIN